MSVENAQKFKELTESDENLQREVNEATKSAKSQSEAFEAIIPIAERLGLPFTKMDLKKILQLDDETLDEVAGGGWGCNDYHSEATYKDCGMTLDWSFWTWTKDKFFWKGQTLTNVDASAVVFFVHANGKQPASLTEALVFKSKNIDKYKEDCKKCNYTT